MDELIEYGNSPIPPEKPGGFSRPRNPDRSIGVDDGGQTTYASASATGYVEVELPSLPGSPNAVERLHARDFGPHVVGRIEASMNRPGYLRSGPQQNPAVVLAHYVATARGSKLLDERTLDYMGRLSKEFTGQKGESRQTYYTTMIRPYLLSLTPKRRQ